MIIIGWIALFFVAFEITQLIIAQRFIGIEQIRANLHPLDTPAPLPSWFSAFWVAALLADYLFQASLLVLPMQTMPDRPYLIRLTALLMIMTSFVGFAMRRSCGIRWGLVILTLEGALRWGFFFFVFLYVVMWQGHWPMYHFSRL